MNRFIRKLWFLHVNLPHHIRGETTADRDYLGHEGSLFLPERLTAEEKNVQSPASVHDGDHPEKTKRKIL